MLKKTQSVIAVPGVHEYGNDEKVDDQPAQRILVSDIHVHENFDSRTFRNDIALLKLSEPIQFSGKNEFSFTSILIGTNLHMLIHAKMRFLRFACHSKSRSVLKTSPRSYRTLPAGA